MTSNLVNKQLQYTYRLISQKVKQPDNEIWSVNRTRQILFFENHAENEAG